MKERPILFSTEMVKAILEGRKTQTRRIVRKQPHGAGEWVRQLASWLFPNVNPYIKLKCPYGQPGDRLWVRETWRIVGWRDGEPFDIEFKDGGKKRDVYLNESRAEDYAIECTDQCLAAGLKTDNDDNFIRPEGGYPTKWRPSIFMPREASRILLGVVDVRVERLRDITEEDVIAEGISLPNYAELAIKDVQYPEPSVIYADLWESINGKGSWDKNPWVWVITFKSLKP